jgi:predicted nucleotidyltransferase
MVDLSDEVRQSLIAWAERTNAVSELWLFGSRAKGTPRDESDVDLAVSLMPRIKEHDWAFGDYVALADAKWRPELVQIVGRSISFGAITPNDKMDHEVRSTGVMLWKRTAAP